MPEGIAQVFTKAGMDEKAEPMPPGTVRKSVPALKNVKANKNKTDGEVSFKLEELPASPSGTFDPVSEN